MDAHRLRDKMFGTAGAERGRGGCEWGVGGAVARGLESDGVSDGITTVPDGSM